MALPTEHSPPPALPTPPRRGLIARVLTLTPPWWGRAAVHFCAALLVFIAGLSAWAGGYEPTRRVSASFRVPSVPSAAWVLVDAEADGERVDVDMSVATQRGPGWVIHRARGWGLGGTAAELPSKDDTRGIFMAWADAVDALGREPPPAPRAAPTAAITVPVPEGVDPALFAGLLRKVANGGVAVFHGRSTEAAWGWAGTAGAVWMLTSLLLAGARGSRERALRTAVATLDAGLCPACRYARAGLAPAAPCPECGADPAAVRAEARAGLGARPPAA